MRKIIATLIFLGLLGLVNFYLPKFAQLPYWFNHFTHFAGGFTAGAFCGAVMSFLLGRRRIESRSLRFTLICLAIFFGAIALGAMWEEFEYIYISRKTLSDWTWLRLYDDTLIDMKMNRYGASAAVAGFIIWKLLCWPLGLFRK